MGYSPPGSPVHGILRRQEHWGGLPFPSPGNLPRPGIKPTSPALAGGFFFFLITEPWGFPGGSVVKNASANAGDVGLIPGLGRSPGEGNGNPLQFVILIFFTSLK